MENIAEEEWECSTLLENILAADIAEILHMRIKTKIKDLEVIMLHCQISKILGIKLNINLVN